MAHTYTSLLYHFVFSTKQRRRLLTPELRERLWPYMARIGTDKRVKILTVGGVEDHVHMVASLPPTLDPAKAIQAVKGPSSKWVSETFPKCRDFAWQQGYGAFTIGISQLEDTKSYIARQGEHHHKRTFKEEYLAFLKKHMIKYDERYVWD